MNPFIRTTSLVILITVAFWFLYNEFTIIQTESQANIESAQAEIQETKKSLNDALRKTKEAQEVAHILVAGDVMLDRGVEMRIKSQNDDWLLPWRLVKDVFQAADLVFVNFEGSASDVGNDTGKKYSFRFDPRSITGLSFAGVDIVSLANNHVLDWGRESLCATTTYLKQAKINYVGGGCNSGESEIPHISVLPDGTRIAWVGYTEFYKGGYATQDTPGLTKYTQEAITEMMNRIREDDLADLIFLSMHWGEEYKTRSNTTQQKVAYDFIENHGVDVVIGHHSHVMQEIERHKDGWIIYSLGNFIFDQNFSEETMKGMVADIQVQKGKVLDVQPYVVQLNDLYQPRFVEVPDFVETQ